MITSRFVNLKLSKGMHVKKKKVFLIIKVNAIEHLKNKKYVNKIKIT